MSAQQKKFARIDLKACSTIEVVEAMEVYLASNDLPLARALARELACRQPEFANEKNSGLVLS